MYSGARWHIAAVTTATSLGVKVCIVRRLLVIALFALFGSQYSCGESLSVPNVDLHCGPRCVQRILEAYGKTEELAELINEVQGSDTNAPSSLDRIDDALKQRGIFTLAVMLSPTEDIIWPSPVLVHLRGTGETLGHFVVQFPSQSPGDASLWLGLSGFHVVPVEKLAARRSGVVLLTSQSIIDSKSVAVVRRRGLQWFLFGVLITLGLCAVTIIFVRRSALNWRNRPDLCT
jgi:ABC-type bacteriocin/lantibiotic exporter with double-glycine peptidase domain